MDDVSWFVGICVRSTCKRQPSHKFKKTLLESRAFNNWSDFWMRVTGPHIHLVMAHGLCVRRPLDFIFIFYFFKVPSLYHATLIVLLVQVEINMEIISVGHTSFLDKVELTWVQDHMSKYKIEDKI